MGRFLYHFGRVEQKIDQAVIKLLDIDERAAPVVTGGIDFVKKVNLVRTCAYEQSSNATDREFGETTCKRVLTVNDARQIIAHASFEPASSGGVQFRRTVSKEGRVRIMDPCWDEQNFGKEYAAMRELESQLDSLIQRIKPTEIPFGWFVPWQDVHHRSSSVGVHAAAMSGGNWPPNK